MTNNLEFQGRISASPLTAAEHALAARMGLEELSPKRFLDAIIHPSADPSNTRFAKLSYMGSAALKMYITEYIYFKYPKLPVAPLTATIGEFYTHSVLFDVAQKYGVQKVVCRLPKNYLTDKTIACQSLLALIGALYWERGALACRQFILNNFCYRLSMNYNPLKHYYYVNSILSAHLRRLQKPRAEYSAMYIMGVYSGEEKLGEGFAPNEKQARRSAAMNALRQFYCVRVEEPDLPSSEDYSATPIEDPGVIFPKAGKEFIGN
ncbi:hypothetical protein O9G_001243 [Rozella allomycis CSF55]|uniref:Uncharacterized protein n=1 Tax=Rozella allomycis (strain CSF55) TaxID=988480 RepID=A0A075AXP6_ROZAC|nr:hypothetical protein O9G_001243 [Rozella allomycis CSF55]|eukprot:EPZ33492.1 hypothetical protein O9G_001243 [Rozella allomycis CSF55]